MLYWKEFYFLGHSARSPFYETHLNTLKMFSSVAKLPESQVACIFFLTHRIMDSGNIG